MIEAINQGLRAHRERRTHIAEDHSKLIQILRTGNGEAEAIAAPGSPTLMGSDPGTWAVSTRTGGRRLPQTMRTAP